ncbi:MAG: diguanylate cyclase [Myxococcota bacterium]
MTSRPLELPGSILTVGPKDCEHAQATFDGLSEVAHLETGAEARCFIEAEAPDFIVVHQDLADLPVSQWLRCMRRSFRGACIPVLVVAEDPNMKELHDCFAEGADDFIVAPFTQEELRMRVSSVFVRQRVARDMSPLTGLPGNLALKTEIERRLQACETFTVLHIDLDHFKAFNDSRGFDAGDEAIRLFADCLLRVASMPRFERVFLGHVGGDDFVALVQEGDGRAFGQALFPLFDQEKRVFYSNEELAEGLVRIRTRKGQLVQAPLLSVSIGGVSTARPGVRDVRRLTHIAAEVKSAAKDQVGNALVIDRRQTNPEAPELAFEGRG